MPRKRRWQATIELQSAQLTGVHATSRRNIRELHRNELKEVERDNFPGVVLLE